MRYGKYANYTGSLRDWRFEQALYAYWCRDMEDCFAILTRICETEVTEDYDHEQTQITAY
jgi:hypothetical protein